MNPIGSFDLLNQNQYFNGWPTLAADPKAIVMAFPVEGWQSSAAVVFRQETVDSLNITVFGANDDVKAELQALAALSLDEDGSGWEKVGKHDEFVAGLQAKYQYMRPTLFHSPYEAAAHFIIGHRISMQQARTIRSAMSKEFGEKIDVEGESFYAFPGPEKLLKIQEFKGLNETKISRLHAVAEAAIEGWLDRKYLRELDDETALAKLETLPGVGPFFSQGILYRGVGQKDSFSHDDMTYHAIKTAYNLSEDASRDDILAVAERWRPYRMWAIVLLHVWLRETNNFPKRTFSTK